MGWFDDLIPKDKNPTPRLPDGPNLSIAMQPKGRASIGAAVLGARPGEPRPLGTDAISQSEYDRTPEVAPRGGDVEAPKMSMPRQDDIRITSPTAQLSKAEDDYRKVREDVFKEYARIYEGEAQEDMPPFEQFFNKARQAIANGAGPSEASAATAQDWVPGYTETVDPKGLFNKHRVDRPGHFASDEGGAAPRTPSTAMDDKPAVSDPAPKGGILKVGDVKDGYQYKGGDPNDPSNWVKVR